MYQIPAIQVEAPDADGGQLVTVAIRLSPRAVELLGHIETDVRKALNDGITRRLRGARAGLVDDQVGSSS